MDSKEIKEMIRQKYSEIALQDKETSCCGSGCCSTEVYNIMSEDYSQLDGYHADADLDLGCGLPTKYAGIKKGDTVIDLGSGAGNDCFVARAETGETGKVIGIDFTPAMIEKARNNAEKRGFNNVEFRQGDIENMPVGGNSADVVVSNCVLNLLPAKDKIFHEIFRVLKPNGHFCISDVVLAGELPAGLKEAAEMYVGCVSGAIQKDRYLVEMFSAGFLQVKIAKETPIVIPDELLGKYLQPDELEKFKTGDVKILSITVTGVKPAEKCNCGSGCC
jgi:SAM-dependent methyltransferase